MREGKEKKKRPVRCILAGLFCFSKSMSGSQKALKVPRQSLLPKPKPFGKEGKGEENDNLLV